VNTLPVEPAWRLAARADEQRWLVISCPASRPTAVAFEMLSHSEALFR